MNRDKVIRELADMAEELCEPHRHSEPIYDRDKWRNKKMTRVYTTTQAGLLAQLREVAAEGLKVSDPTPSTGKPKSKPPGVFEAFQRHVYIAVESGRWCTQLGLNTPRNPEDCIRALVGKAANLDDATLEQVVKEVRYWHRSACSATGWSTPPYTPAVLCPNCRAFSSLKISFRDEKWEHASAYCTNAARTPEGELVCGMAWPEGEMDELRDYVRAASGSVLAQAG